MDQSNLKENSSDSSIDSNIEIVNENEINLINKENVDQNKMDQTLNQSLNNHSIKETSKDNLSYASNLSKDFLDLDRSRSSIDLSFSQKTMIKYCSLRSLISDFINDEILIDKNELSKDLEEFEKEKLFQIIKIIKQEESDQKIEQLKEMCITEKGLILSHLRRIVWPIITNSNHIKPNSIPDKEIIKNHPMYTQVIQDVNRTIKRFPPSIEKEERLSKEKQLVDLIMRILIENPNFYYYQGYHDICITFLLLFGEEKAFHITNKVSQTHLFKFMEETMDSTQLLLELIPCLIKREDKELFNFLEKIEIGTIFSLSWIITWFSHVLVKNQNVERLFDIFIASDFRLPIYFTVSILLYHREIILKTEKDLAMVFQCITGLLNNEAEFPFELLLKKALDLIENYPPEKLANEQKERLIEQKKKEQELRNLFLSKNKKPNKIIKVIKNNKGILAASLLVAVTAVTIQYYKNQ